MSDFGAPQSRNEAILQNILGAENELPDPQSNIEKLLQAILYEDETIVDFEPASRAELLLYAILTNGEYTAEPQSRNEAILKAILTRGEYDALPQSRIEELLQDWLDQRHVYTKTVSGPVAHVTDAIAAPAVDVTVQIVPYQSGTGDPSPENIRPISGWTGANVYHSGADTSDYDTYPVTWQSEAGTVYGGTLDVTTGKLTAEYRLVTFDGTEEWFAQGTRSYYYTYVGPYNSCINDVGVCSHLRERSDINNGNTIKGFRIYNRSVIGVNNATVLFRFDSTKQQTLEQFKTYLAEQYAAETPVQVAYKLSPDYCTEYQLTPTEIELFLGDNNVWADTGDTSLTYKGTEPPAASLSTAGLHGLQQLGGFSMPDVIRPDSEIETDEGPEEAEETEAETEAETEENEPEGNDDER